MDLMHGGGRGRDGSVSGYLAVGREHALDTVR